MSAVPSDIVFDRSMPSPVRIAPMAFNLATVTVGLLSVASVVVAHFFGTHVWRLLMSDQGHRVPTRLAVQVFFISQLGKYLPGNVGQFIGRGVLAKSTGIPVGVAVGTALALVARGEGCSVLPTSALKADPAHAALPQAPTPTEAQKSEAQASKELAARVAADFAVESMLLAPLPAESFDTALTMSWQSSNTPFTSIARMLFPKVVNCFS